MLLPLLSRNDAVQDLAVKDEQSIDCRGAHPTATGQVPARQALVGDHRRATRRSAVGQEEDAAANGVPNRGTGAPFVVGIEMELVSRRVRPIVRPQLDVLGFSHVGKLLGVVPGQKVAQAMNQRSQSTTVVIRL